LLTRSKKCAKNKQTFKEFIYVKYCKLCRNADRDYADVWNSDRIHWTYSCRCRN